MTSLIPTPSLARDEPGLSEAESKIQLMILIYAH